MRRNFGQYALPERVGVIGIPVRIGAYCRTAAKAV